ncbi:MAG: hypothetical protein PWP39_1664 [Pyrococcus sp.]|uniref:phospholipase D-like domain-containing protein n=1 Tax=Pyrococcus sp. TaxID=33866 RepID=UPI002584A6B1|nr:phospholipase D-like domain-containing protein [Pyrococcus sp.]MDK2870429.1 hypothetical protein [Pyrococcus sp.]
MPFKKIVEDRMRRGPILKRLREQFFKASTKILDAVDFEGALKGDLKNAKKLVVIASPFLSKQKVSRFLSFKEVGEGIEKGVKFIVITRPADKKEVGDPKEHEECVQMLKEKGIRVVEQPRLHFKCVIVDESIIYHLGSINPLSIMPVSYVPPDYMVRFESEALVDEIIENVIGREEYEHWTKE